MNTGAKTSFLSKHNLSLLFKRKSEVVVVYLLMIILAIIAGTYNNAFFTTRNLQNLFSKSIGLLFITYAQVMIISLGGVDLSVGSIISVVNVVAVRLMTDSVSSWIMAMLACLGIGLLIGTINGALVVYGKIQAIIATLATQTIFGGVALLILSSPKGQFPSELCTFVTKGWNYIFPIVLMLLVTLIVWWFINRTRLGRNILATGGNAFAAECSGIKVGKTKMLAFALSGLMSAVAALYISLYSTSGNPLIGSTYTQLSITTAVVGGASLAGGKCSIAGCVAAAVVMNIINNMLNLMHVSSYYQFVIQGVILILALAISAIRARKG